MSALDEISIRLKEIPLDGDFKHTLELLEECNKVDSPKQWKQNITIDKEEVLEELSNGASDEIFNLIESAVRQNNKSIYNENGSIKSVYTVLEMLSDVWNEETTITK